MKKVTFVIAEPMLHEHLSVMYLSAALKSRGHAASLVYFPTDPYNKDRIVEALRAEEPDFVALSFMSGVKEHYASLARHIKDRVDVRIVVGGPAATFDKTLRERMDPFDAVCVGEGDLAFADFIEQYGRGAHTSAIRNFTVKTRGAARAASLIGFDQLRQHGGGVADGASASELMDLIDPLDQLPFPDRGILYDRDPFLKDLSIKMFMSGRGCPYLCTYCFNHAYNEMYRGKGKIIRHKSVDYFLEEIRQVRSESPLDGIVFEDDVFIIDRGWLEEFARKYPEAVGLPYMCYVRPNLMTKEVVRHLAESNCYSVRVAVECGNATLRNKVLKRNLTDKQILDCCNMLHEAGIKVQTINMVGLPTETIENMQETLKLNQQCRPYHTTANMFMPLPGVEITNVAISEGLLDQTFVSPKTAYHTSSMRYPEDVRRFLGPFQSLFGLFVMFPRSVRLAPVLMRLPRALLRGFDTAYRLYRNSRFYPPARVTVIQRLKAARRYWAYTAERG
jgi:radical SAM superfamily enzyme YgiQ (UPF0313 family)